MSVTNHAPNTLSPLHPVHRRHASVEGVASYTLFHSDARDLLNRFGDDSVPAIITDIPYGEVNERASNGIREWNVGGRDTVNFDVASIVLRMYMVASGWLVVYCGTLQISTVCQTLRAAGASVRVVPFIKSNPSPVTSQTGVASIELAVFAPKPGAPWYGDTVLQELRCGSARRRVNGIRALKSGILMAHVVRHLTAPGDLVLDPFMGVGTTGEAAIQHGRHFVGGDIDPVMFRAAESHLRALPTLRTVAQLRKKYPPRS